MLTEKGRFVLNSLRRGLNVSVTGYDRLWQEINDSRLEKRVVRLCRTCGQEVEGSKDQ